MSTTAGTTVFELDLPTLDVMDGDFDEVADLIRRTAERSWIARNPFGFSILHYDDVVAILRDKRWHSAAGMIASRAGR